MRMQNFEPKMVDLPPIFFLKKIINIIFIYILTPLIVKILKADPELSACAMHAGMQFLQNFIMNQKNFCFTPIPDKTNDVIFLKNPYSIFDHFWSFLPDGNFSKKSSSGTHSYIWAPNTMLCFRKN